MSERGGAGTLNPKAFTLLNSSWSLIFGETADSDKNLYLGTEHVHEWGDWTITTEPTLEGEGEAERVCAKNNTHKDVKTLPALTDENVWTAGARVEPTEDTDGSQEYSSEYGKVTVVLPATGHTHEWGDWTITTEPTLEGEGEAERVCTKNNTHKDVKTLPVLTDENVWTAGARVEPTEDTDGSQEYSSEYGKVTVVLPAVGKNSGEIAKEVEKGENAPDVNLSETTEELADAVLTEEEKQQTENGVDIKILLTVEDAEDSVSAGDKAAVEAALDGYQKGQYLDISLFKIIGEQQNRVSETKAALRITVAIPDNLKNTDDTKVREYRMIRVHNGESLILEDLDSDPDTVTIETDRFSTYAIAFKDTVKSTGDDGGNTGDDGGNTGDDGGNTGDDSGNTGDDGGNTGDDSGSTGDDGGNTGDDSGNTGDDGGNTGDDGDDNAGDEASKPAHSKDDEPKTGGGTPVMMCATLAMIAGFAYLTLYFGEHSRGMTEETKKELTSKLIRWARRGGRGRRIIALAGIFLLLVYYHSIGKKTSVEWEEVHRTGPLYEQ